MVTEAPVVVLPYPTPVKLHNIHWEVQVDLNGEDTKVWFALSPGDYENLSVNMAELLRWNREVKWLLKYYINEVKPDEHIRRGHEESGKDDSE